MELMFDLQQWQYFHFLRPYWLLLLLPMSFIFYAFFKPQQDLQAWRQVMSKTMLFHLTVKNSGSGLLSPKLFLVLISLIGCLVLAGPSWRQQASPFSEDRSALVIVLDVSESMEQSDVQPSRLVRAKHKILQLLQQRGDAKTALVVYSGSAHILMPVTNDSDMIRHFLDSVSSNMMPVAGKSLATSLTLIEQLLAPTATTGTVLVMTDGVNQIDIPSFERYFSQYNHQFLLWAFGRQQGGETTLSYVPRQQTSLLQLASAVDGNMVEMTDSDDDIFEVNKRISQRVTVVDDQSLPWFDEGYYLVFVMAGLFLFWFRKGWTLLW